jgi:ATP-dependent RNA helicase SUPV3L1/SUV3
MRKGAVKAVLGPTNTGKTHLAIERMCAHSSGAIGFPLRLLAREVYDRVVAIKGERQVALLTGEERIEPPDARYWLCTVEAMPRRLFAPGPAEGAAFVAVDEAQLGSDMERGHVFTDRVLNARGRDETMLLGAATLEPVLRQLEPDLELVERPRFSTLRHTGSIKLSRLPRRSAVVAFSVEQVYLVAEMLRRHRGGAAVVMGGLSPETRNRQVEMFQSGEVDYLVATDAIGMGLNLDLDHVAFAGLSKFDGRRQRRLTPAELAQIAGRAGRHQRDGTFGTVSGAPGLKAVPQTLTDEEVFAIEEHRFAPLTQLYWREAEPRFDSLETLVADLEAKPDEPALRAAPEALDLAVLKRLLDEPFAKTVSAPASVRRFWDACSLPDFSQRGAEMHARFVARLWQDLQHGYLRADYVAARISDLDRVQGDIDTLQGRIAGIRSWAYICQRPDWVLARQEMAARARAAEARLSDALHARLSERFVNRRTTILMRSLANGAPPVPVAVDREGVVTVDDERLGRLQGFRFVVDPDVAHSDRQMLVAAAERALPAKLAERAAELRQSGFAGVALSRGTLRWEGDKLADLSFAPGGLDRPVLSLSPLLSSLLATAQAELLSGLQGWLEQVLKPLAPYAELASGARDPEVNSEVRGLLHRLAEGFGIVARQGTTMREIPREYRPVLRRFGVTIGSLDVFVPSLLKPAPRRLLHELGLDDRPSPPEMPPVLTSRKVPAGYRRAGSQLIRVDLAEKVLAAAHRDRQDRRRRSFVIDPALAISVGLTPPNFKELLASGGFHRQPGEALPPEAYGPPRPVLWNWQPRGTRPQKRHRQRVHPGHGPFDELRQLLG